MPNITLTDEELLLLDGKCSENTQKEVIAALARIECAKSHPELPEKLAKFIASAVDEARNEGQLIYRSCNIHTCKTCGKNGGYYKYPRNGRYHRKGESNYSKPRYISGVELADRFVIMQGNPAVGCCNECFEQVKPFLAAALENIPCQVSERITGHPTRWKRYKKRECSKCGWTGHEGQLGKLPAMMGGFYPGKCPSCGTENRLFGMDLVKSVNGFDLVEVTGSLVHQ